MGVSVENQQQTIRAHRLIQVPAAIRFLSVEPMLGPVTLGESIHALDWVIAGGESGPDCRPCDEQWLRDLQRYCGMWGVPFFLKQLGGFPDKRGHDKAVLDGRLWRDFPNQATKGDRRTPDQGGQQ
jgi:protein gp37